MCQPLEKKKKMSDNRGGGKEFQRKIPVEEHGLKKVGHINPKYAVAHSIGITGNEPNTEREELGFGVTIKLSQNSWVRPLPGKVQTETLLRIN
ncbi:MAG: hypothetical protein Q8P67_16350 [archaeon]|nr:hypothetical protein [archaeon]